MPPREHGHRLLREALSIRSKGTHPLPSTTKHSQRKRAQLRGGRKRQHSRRGGSSRASTIEHRERKRRADGNRRTHKRRGCGNGKSATNERRWRGGRVKQRQSSQLPPTRAPPAPRPTSATSTSTSDRGTRHHQRRGGRALQGSMRHSHRTRNSTRPRGGRADATYGHCSRHTESTTGWQRGGDRGGRSEARDGTRHAKRSAGKRRGEARGTPKRRGTHRRRGPAQTSTTVGQQGLPHEAGRWGLPKSSTLCNARSRRRETRHIIGRRKGSSH